MTPRDTLPLAIARHVTPGMHLHFASTPSRSNAAIRELARQMAAEQGGDPEWFVTGGGMQQLAPLLDAEAGFWPHLVLTGIAMTCGEPGGE